MTQIPLRAAKIDVLADSGDEIVLPFEVVDTNTTGWTVIWELYAADPTYSRPIGDILGTGDVTNTPVVDGDSTLTLTLQEVDTEDYPNQVLFLRMIKTSDPRRTLAKGPLRLDGLTEE